MRDFEKIQGNRIYFYFFVKVIKYCFENYLNLHDAIKNGETTNVFVKNYGIFKFLQYAINYNRFI